MEGAEAINTMEPSAEMSDVTELDSWDDIEIEEVVDEAPIEDSSEVKEENADPIEQDEPVISENEEEVEEKSDEDSEEAESEPEEAVKELDLNASVEVTVNGEKMEVPIQELINNYSGKVEYSKRFNELSSAKKEFEAEIAQMDKHVEDFGKYIEKDDVFGAMSHFANFANIPSHQLKHKMLVAFKDEYERILSMTPEQYNLEYQSQENEYLKQQVEKTKEASAKEQANRALQEQRLQFQKDLSISDDEWSEASAFLDERLKADPELAKSLDMSPKTVANYIQRYRADLKASEIVGAVDANLKENDGLINTIVDIMLQNPAFSEQEIKDMVVQQYELYNKNKATAKLSQKIEKKAVKAPAKKAEKTDLKPLESWDDI